MDCERFDRTTMDLLYGELDELSEAAAMRHLHHCTRCRDIWGHLRTTKDLAALPQEPPPDGLFTDILAAEIYSAFRGQLLSPLRTQAFFGVLSRPIFPQESSYISEASIANLSSFSYVPAVLLRIIFR